VIIHAVAEADRPDPLEGGAPQPRQTPAQALAEALRPAYVARTQAYYEQLADVQSSDVTRSTDPRASGYPSLVRSRGETEAFIIDGDLFSSLFDLYLAEGWPGIAELEADVAAVARPQGQLDAPSAGVPAQRWLHAYRFFVYGRNMLALMLRDALLRIESLAATRLVADLSVTASALAAAWDQFGITREVQSPGVDAPLGDDLITYRFANQALMSAVFAAVAGIIDQRAAFEALLDEITGLADDLRLVNADIGRYRQLGSEPVPSSLARKAKLENQTAQLESLRDASAGFEAAMKTCWA
jgi:hypothetical protein